MKRIRWCRIINTLNRAEMPTERLITDLSMLRKAADEAKALLCNALKVRKPVPSPTSPV